MYLSRKKYIGANYEHRNVKAKVSIIVGDKKIPVDVKKLSYIEEAVGYWRKANQIHKWFVDNCQDGEDDCRQAYVSLNQLKELLSLCKQIKEKAILKEGKVKNGERIENGEWVPIMEDGKYIENAEEIAELLPTEEGFFFGGTNYDEYYLSDIDETIKLLEPLIKEENDLNKQGLYSEFYYQSSW